MRTRSEHLALAAAAAPYNAPWERRFRKARNSETPFSQGVFPACKLLIPLIRKREPAGFQQTYVNRIWQTAVWVAAKRHIQCMEIALKKSHSELRGFLNMALNLNIL